MISIVFVKVFKNYFPSHVYETVFYIYKKKKEEKFNWNPRKLCFLFASK